jgi:hypothetical protein
MRKGFNGKKEMQQYLILTIPTGDASVAGRNPWSAWLSD